MRKLPLDETREQAAPRFWARVSKAPHPKGCWEWQGALTSRKTYGRLLFNGYEVFAHRVAWSLTHGQDPGDLYVLHHCDNPPCCNPEHLFLGTAKDNADDAIKKGRFVYVDKLSQAKLTPDQVREIRRLPKRHGDRTKIAARYGVSTKTISRIRSGTRWGHLPD